MSVVEFDYNKLRGRIKEKCGTQDAFAAKLGIGRVSLSQSLNNARDFSGDEIYRSCEILGISREQIPVVFFTQKFRKANKGGENV